MPLRKTCAVIPFLIMFSVSGVHAEIKLDGTLGTQGNIAGPNYAIEAAMGKQQGASLFHSFEKFDVGTGESAIFKGPADVERIISRVTGGSASNIDGLIKSEIQGADFYFINPFGMIFGPNASLDITGSFYATSADYVKLGQNGRFDAKNPENTVLTADAPEAFGFLGQKSGDITVQAGNETGTDAETGTTVYSGLKVDGDTRMMLAGGDIRIDKGIVQTHSGNLDVAAVVSAGELDISSPDVGKFESLGMIEICNSGYLFTEGGGNIKCQADSVAVVFGSSIATSAEPGISGAGDVILNTRNYVTVSGSDSGLSSTVGSYVSDIPDALSGMVSIDTGHLCINDGGAVLSMSIGSGDSGDIRLDAGRLEVTDGGSIITAVYGGIGRAGNVAVNALESVYISGFYQMNERTYYSSIISKAQNSSETYETQGGRISVNSPVITIEKTGRLSTESLDAGSSGDIILNTEKLELLDGGYINASISGGNGNSGDIDIKASESVHVSGSYEAGDSVYLSGVFSRLIDSEYSYGGDISIETPELVVNNIGALSTESVNSGSSGNIALDVVRLKLLDGGYIYAIISEGKGRAGNINVKASESVYVSGFRKDGDDIEPSSIYSSAFDSPDAEGGRILIEAPQILIENRGYLTASSQYAGEAGSIGLYAECLKLAGGGKINASIYDGEKAGNIEIKASESVYVSGFYRNEDEVFPSSLFSMAVDSDDAEGGRISVEAPEVVIEKQGVLTTSAFHSGSSGDIHLTVDRLKLVDGGCIKSSSLDAGRAGNLTITGRHFFSDSGMVDMTADSSCGGNIFFNISDFFFMNNTSLATDVSGGTGGGGDVAIARPEFTVLRDSTIDASAKGGNGGNIGISSGYFIKDAVSKLDASSELGIDGKIEISSPYIDLDTGLFRLSGEYRDLAALIHNPCLDRMSGKTSTLTVGPKIIKRKNPFAYFESEN